jgi:hypothetical protein
MSRDSDNSLQPKKGVPKKPTLSDKYVKEMDDLLVETFNEVKYNDGRRKTMTILLLCQRLFQSRQNDNPYCTKKDTFEQWAVALNE